MDGKTDAVTPLRSYRIGQEYSVFSSDTLLSYSVRILHSGNLVELSVVTSYVCRLFCGFLLIFLCFVSSHIWLHLCRAHGTHVAGILGAHFPDDPERCGIAPGAQIISLKIADSRINMETGKALVRALAYLMENKCIISLFGLKRSQLHPSGDVANMSFGEPSLLTGGRFSSLLDELVYDHGC
jgi:tripeptidyl-peptidase-2